MVLRSILAAVVAVVAMVPAVPAVSTMGCNPAGDYYALCSALAAAPVDRYAWEVGDDNGDGVIAEDETGWSCATMGNGVCGAQVSPSGVETGAGDYVGGYN